MKSHISSLASIDLSGFEVIRAVNELNRSRLSLTQNMDEFRSENSVSLIETKPHSTRIISGFSNYLSQLTFEFPTIIPPEQWDNLSAHETISFLRQPMSLVNFLRQFCFWENHSGRRLPRLRQTPEHFRRVPGLLPDAQLQGPHSSAGGSFVNSGSFCLRELRNAVHFRVSQR